MRGEPAPDDLFVLYDVARGFLGLEDEEAVGRHAVLTAMGACGASAAVLLARSDDGGFRVAAARGAVPADPGPIRLPARTESALKRLSAPWAAGELEELGPFGRNLTRKLDLEVVVPVSGGGSIRGLLGVGERLLGEPYGERELGVLAQIAELAGLAWGSDSEASDERGRRGAGRFSAREMREGHPALNPIVGEGPAISRLLEEILSVADFELPILIAGETGTGKELVARALHDLSPRAGEPFEAINCAAIPRDLMASALFGHEQGAFTSAVSSARGAFERAGAGTLFLDEVGDMPLETQAMLLRVLQERRFRRVGGEKPLPVRCHVLSASNRDLGREVAASRFRADLFYRIRMYTIGVPPLRKHLEDLPLLVRHILDGWKGKRKTMPEASPGFLRALAERPLPGNVRELESLVLGAVVRARGARRLLPEHLTGAEPETGRDGTGAKRPERGEVPSYAEMEREYIRSVLQITEGNKRQAAALMGIPRTTLNARIRKLGLA